MKTIEEITPPLAKRGLPSIGGRDKKIFGDC